MTADIIHIDDPERAPNGNESRHEGNAFYSAQFYAYRNDGKETPRSVLFCTRLIRGLEKLRYPHSGVKYRNVLPSLTAFPDSSPAQPRQDEKPPIHSRRLLLALTEGRRPTGGHHRAGQEETSDILRGGTPQVNRRFSATQTDEANSNWGESINKTYVATQA